MSTHLQTDKAALAELKAERDVAERKVESLQMTLAALKDDNERLKGAEASLKSARANLKDREEKLRAMSKQLDAARCALRLTGMHALSDAACMRQMIRPRMHGAATEVGVSSTQSRSKPWCSMHASHCPSAVLQQWQASCSPFIRWVDPDVCCCPYPAARAAAQVIYSSLKPLLL